jgi:hypothetical protein
MLHDNMLVGPLESTLVCDEREMGEGENTCAVGDEKTNRVFEWIMR